MKRAIFSTFLFILFLLFLSITYLSFFGFETDRFNSVIKSEIKKSNSNVNLDFKKISILLDLKKIILFVKFTDPKIEFHQVSIPLKSLRTDIDLDFLNKKKFSIKRVVLDTKYLDFTKTKPFLYKIGLKKENLNIVKSGKFKIQNLILEFDENFKLINDLVIQGDIIKTNIALSKTYEINNFKSKFSYKKNFFGLEETSWNLNNNKNLQNEFFDGAIIFKQIGKKLSVDLKFQTNKASILPSILLMNYSFSKENISTISSELLLHENKSIFIKNLNIKDSNNEIQIKNLHLDKNYNLINFNSIKVKTRVNKEVNNDFSIMNKDQIIIKGKVFDAKNLIKELNKSDKNDKFFNKISKDIQIDFDNVQKIAKFPLKNFRLIGTIKKGSFEKISAKSDFSEKDHLDISLKKSKETQKKILEVYSDIALPLLSDYKFFQGLEGGNLNFLSNFDNKESTNLLNINNFKLNEAPALAKLLSLADLKGLTDTLKGDGISFDTLSVKYSSNSSKMTIQEIFMIGPSISILMDGYVEKKNGLVSLKGTLVPAKTLNNLISRIPVVGDLLIGKEIGEGVFGISFKIKGLPNNLKTTVNPVKTLTPRFITRAIEARKKIK